MICACNDISPSLLPSFDETMHHLPFAAENTLADSAPAVIFGDNEFPPLKPDDGWQLVQDEEEPFVVRQEEDWQCIVQGHKENRSPLYAHVAQSAATLPQAPPPSASSSSKRSPSAARPVRNSKASTGMAALDDEPGDEQFAHYKSSNWLRRRYRPIHPAYCKKPLIQQQQQQQQQPDATNSAAKRMKRRARAKKQPTKTWMERESGWVAIHSKLRNK
ncbi:hypothetical protein BJV82DRAFT_634298 [Fennellomyces sp. T-0311]|nr:hypothetical protein BJV82DRAFT_634298 [Fennellomyces sp. T-0311]